MIKKENRKYAAIAPLDEEALRRRMAEIDALLVAEIGGDERLQSSVPDYISRGDTAFIQMTGLIRPPAANTTKEYDWDSRDSGSLFENNSCLIGSSPQDMVDVKQRSFMEKPACPVEAFKQIIEELTHADTFKKSSVHERSSTETTRCEPTPCVMKYFTEAEKLLQELEQQPREEPLPNPVMSPPCPPVEKVVPVPREIRWTNFPAPSPCTPPRETEKTAVEVEPCGECDGSGKAMRRIPRPFSLQRFFAHIALLLIYFSVLAGFGFFIYQILLRPIIAPPM